MYRIPGCLVLSLGAYRLMVGSVLSPDPLPRRRFFAWPRFTLSCRPLPPPMLSIIANPSTPPVAAWRQRVVSVIRHGRLVGPHARHAVAGGGWCGGGAEMQGAAAR